MKRQSRSAGCLMIFYPQKSFALLSLMETPSTFLLIRLKKNTSRFDIPSYGQLETDTCANLSVIGGVERDKSSKVGVTSKIGKGLAVTLKTLGPSISPKKSLKCLAWIGAPPPRMLENTLPETKIGPENRPKRKGSSSNHQFSGAMLVSGRVKI